MLHYICVDQVVTVLQFIKLRRINLKWQLIYRSDAFRLAKTKYHNMHLFLRLSTIFKIDFFHCDNFDIVKPAKLLAIDMYETFIIYYLLLFLSSDFLQSFQWETIFATPCLLSCTSRSFRNSVYCKRSKLILQKTFIDKKGKIILDRIKALHMYPFPLNLDDA